MKRTGIKTWRDVLGEMGDVQNKERQTTETMKARKEASKK